MIIYKMHTNIFHKETTLNFLSSIISHILLHHLLQFYPVLGLLFQRFQVITSQTIHNEIDSPTVPCQESQTVSKIRKSHSTRLRLQFGIEFEVIFELFSCWVGSSFSFGPTTN